jgi:hypothetical protein
MHHVWDMITPSKESRLLLIVDQFEELFRYYEKDSAEEARSFAALLQSTCQHTDMYIVLTMRSEYIGDCALFPGFTELINQGIYLTPRLTRDQLQEAITEPAAVFGAHIEPSVINTLLNETGDNPDQLPVLQHALMRMWTIACNESPDHPHITESHYHQTGGLKQALSNHADEAYNELNENQQVIAEILFRCLCERGSDLRDTRRPVSVGNIADVAEVNWQDIATVADGFRKKSRCFLTPSIDIPLSQDTILDISHESLIRQWKRMNDWSIKERELAETYMRLEDTANRWENNKASLLRTPELENTLKWRDEANPTKSWSERYGLNDMECLLKK